MSLYEVQVFELVRTTYLVHAEDPSAARLTAAAIGEKVEWQSERVGCMAVPVKEEELNDEE